MAYYTTKQINSWLYSIYDPLGVYCYLATGNDSALLFDTAHGIGSLPDLIREITDKPLTVVVSHGHIDHSSGAYQFDEAWMNEGDFDLTRMHTSEEFRERFVVDVLAEKKLALPDGFIKESFIKAGTGNLKNLNIGRVFDLGGLQLEVVAMEGHTHGSVGLLSREQRILLDSDAANSHIWMFLDESLPVSSYIAMLERTMKLDFDTFFVGHSDSPLPKTDFEKYIAVARNASMEKAKPYAIFPELKGFLYQEDRIGIVFSEAKLM
ncbi:MAG: MBL fold metallo-hydrolase [Treponema sp.]|jgi:glyoxylase-like metal-dependent hydrolase (beta-lactamase superfamily II)|nr:MBL fold metallo-hydrolase [Treponema sp.]